MCYIDMSHLKKKGSCPSARGQRTKKNAHPHWKGARAGGSLFGNFSMTRLGDCLRIRISWHQASSYLLFFKGMVEGCDCVKGGEGGALVFLPAFIETI